MKKSTRGLQGIILPGSLNGAVYLPPDSAFNL